MHVVLGSPKEETENTRGRGATGGAIWIGDKPAALEQWQKRVWCHLLGTLLTLSSIPDGPVSFLPGGTIAEAANEQGPCPGR